MNLPAMIATDLDGTLLGAGGAVSARTCAALEAAHEAGVVLVAATGRSRRTALGKLAPCPVIRWAVCSNGAMIWDRADDVMDLHRPLRGADALALVAHLGERLDDIGFGWETAAGFGFDERFLGHRPPIDEFLLDHGAPRPDHDTEVTKLLLSHAEHRGNDLYLHLADHLPPGVTVASSGGAFLEATAAGVDKASTVALLADRLCIEAAEVMAFGDQHNDLPLLRWAGVGVAMGNAHPEVASAVDMRAPSNHEHGVAVIIEQLLGA